MSRCPSCAEDTPERSRFCPHCGQVVEPVRAAAEATLTRFVTPTPPPSRPGESRFLPGNVVAGRYRIVGLLGRGGMGEVYRADDLKLGQAVALKFLPHEVERDPQRLERFMNEVRLALRITHPNVCRVHDIGEVAGQHFISMEYVDGEDLASLLRRIGRLPQERGVEIARQICAGLGAAHEEGILHRDLKPANVMIDGRGRARITDFGLAELAGTVEGDAARAGTPAYMAPEQLAGGKVTTRSDVYALGLVLYEIFTGKPAFRARSAAEMARLQQSSLPTAPTTHVRGLDPAIEAVVQRAIETDPARRPASALAVAAALPGGDPLAAALAAGETPSPEMVAEAGQAGGLAPGWVALCLAVILGGTVAGALLAPANDALGYIEAPLSITALHERARLMSERLGLANATADSAHGLTSVDDYVEWLHKKEERGAMRERVAAGRPPVYVLWYRESPERLVPVDPMIDRVGESDPPVTTPGMVSLQVDPQARLVRLAAVPPDRDEAASTETADLEALWTSLFAEAGLDRDRFAAAEPSRTPPSFADARAAWEGSLAEAPDTPLRVEAAAFRGRPVSFRIVGPWTRDRGTSEPPDVFETIVPWIFLAIVVSVLSGLGLLARRNLNSGRSDLRGARRVGLYVLGVELLSALFGGGFLFGPQAGLERFFLRLAMASFLAAVVFLSYVALEPYVRRLWPATLISWTRLLAGRFADPLIGRDLLIGAALGVFTAFLWRAHTRLPGLLGLPEEPLAVGAAWGSQGPLAAVSALMDIAAGAVAVPMLTLLALVLLRLLLRRSWAAVGVFFVVSVVLPVLDSPHAVLDAVIRGVVMGLTLIVTLRVGLVALASMTLFEYGLQGVRTLDPSSWIGPMAMVHLVALLGVAAHAAAVALGGRAVLQEEV
jgi:serine/threonine-protein kinase